MTRTTSSARIVQRLNEQGWEVLRPPVRNMFYLNSGWRSSGTCCWWARIRRSNSLGVVEEGVVTSLFTMRQVAGAKTWDLHWYQPHFGYVLDLDHNDPILGPVRTPPTSRCTNLSTTASK